MYNLVRVLDVYHNRLFTPQLVGKIIHERIVPEGCMTTPYPHKIHTGQIPDRIAYLIRGITPMNKRPDQLRDVA